MKGRMALAVTIFAVSCAVLIGYAGARDSSGAPSGRIVAELAEPGTRYALEIYDPDGDALTIDWYPFFDCGWLTPGDSALEATWNHPEGSQEQGGCPHAQSGDHSGSVLVTVDDGTGNRVECRYEGSSSGEEQCGGAQSSPSPDQSPSPSPSPSPEGGGDASAGPRCPGFEQVAKEQIVGTSGPDVLVGGPHAEVVCGLGGNDVLKGRGGDDILLGGAGRDDLRGGPGRDRLRGGKGRDRCRGGPGDDAPMRGCESHD